MTPAVEAHGLSKSYGALRAVDGLELEVPAGIVLGFLGPNGAGKTTAIRMLTTILSPTAGSFTVAGVPHTRPPEIRQPHRRPPRERRLSRPPDRGGISALPRAALRPLRALLRVTRPPRSSTRWGWPRAAARLSPVTAEGCASGSASLARSSTTPRSSSSTSRPSDSTPPASGRCSSSSSESRRSEAPRFSSARISSPRSRRSARKS